MPGKPVRLLMVLSENHAIVPPRDLRGLVDLAVQAEAAGVDGVMLSEHVVLGRDAAAAGAMANPRDYAAPGNQPPSTAWPSPLVLLSAIAQATATLRLVAGAIIAPLRHPLLLAKELGTLDLLSQGRLIVLPTVSWSRDEYAALGVPFGDRGRILDEQLVVLARAWGPYPVSHPGPRFPLTDADLAMLAAVMTEHGRDLSELELVGSIRGRFTGPDGTADLDEALADLPRQLAQGFTTICFKPAMFASSAAEVGALCRELVTRVAAITGDTRTPGTPSP